MLEKTNTHRTEKRAYDEHLYEPFLKVGALQAYEYLNGDGYYRSEQKRQFLAGETNNPNLDYPLIDTGMLKDAETALVSMKHTILSDETNEAVRKAYQWRINEKIAEVRMLQATAAGDMRRFKRYSEFIYGKPSTDTFAYTIASIGTEALGLTESSNTAVSQAAAQLLELLPLMDQPATTELPSAETVQLAHDQTIQELGGLINIPPEVIKLDAEQMKTVFESAIHKTGSKDWQVEIDSESSRTAVSVNQEQMSVKIPGIKTVGQKKLAGLIVHEIGTHVSRRVNGEGSVLKLLGIGLDRYEPGDEGVATMREQALNNKVDDFRGLDGLLAVGLALGSDGQPRDFRQTYEILERYYYLRNVAKNNDIAEALVKAQNSAWNRCIRTFRGTDCATPGACFTKDIIYRNGSIGIWDVISNNPNEMMRFNIGKYDPTNPRHIWILESLGISDQDLIDLEK